MDGEDLVGVGGQGGEDQAVERGCQCKFDRTEGGGKQKTYKRGASKDIAVARRAMALRVEDTAITQRLKRHIMSDMAVALDKLALKGVASGSGLFREEAMTRQGRCWLQGDIGASHQSAEDGKWVSELLRL